MVVANQPCRATPTKRGDAVLPADIPGAVEAAQAARQIDLMAGVTERRYQQPCDPSITRGCRMIGRL